MARDKFVIQNDIAKIKIGDLIAELSTVAALYEAGQEHIAALKKELDALKAEPAKVAQLSIVPTPVSTTQDAEKVG